MGKSFLFCCPITGQTVQGYSEANESPQDERRYYEAVTCVACGRLHIVNPATGKLLSEESDQ